MKHFSHHHNRFTEIERFAVQSAFRASGDPVDRHPRAEVVGRSGRGAPFREPATAEGAARRFWPWPGLVFVLLGANVAIVAITVYLATSDRSFSVEPDYYRKALDWDVTAAQLAHSKDLGWTVSVVAAPSGSPIAARLVDPAQEPISGAQLAVVAFQSARAGHRLETVLEEIEPGLYRSTEVLMRPGVWELRFTAKVGGETFTQVVSHIVQEAGR